MSLTFVQDVHSINFHVVMCSLVPRPSHVFQCFTRKIEIVSCEMLKNMERPGYEASDVCTVDWEFILGVINFSKMFILWLTTFYCVMVVKFCVRVRKRFLGAQRYYTPIHAFCVQTSAAVSGVMYVYWYV